MKDIDSAGIEAMDKLTLLRIWQKRLPKVPVPNLHTKILRKALAYELQIKEMGDLSRQARQTLTAHLPETAKANQAGHIVPAGRTRPAIQPGTIFIREWNGRRYQVKALNRGFEMDGRTYKSLTQIAHAITNAHWSAPRFFGLTKAPKAQAA